jgi:hypothetical protein
MPDDEEKSFAKGRKAKIQSNESLELDEMLLEALDKALKASSTTQQSKSRLKQHERVLEQTKKPEKQPASRANTAISSRAPNELSLSVANYDLESCELATTSKSPTREEIKGVKHNTFLSQRATTVKESSEEHAKVKSKAVKRILKKVKKQKPDLKIDMNGLEHAYIEALETATLPLCKLRSSDKKASTKAEPSTQSDLDGAKKLLIRLLSEILKSTTKQVSTDKATTSADKITSAELEALSSQEWEELTDAVGAGIYYSKISDHNEASGKSPVKAPGIWSQSLKGGDTQTASSSNELPSANKIPAISSTEES